MEQQYSAEDLEVALILRMLPQLMWEAESVLPCSHNFRWGARKRRSAGDGEAPPPPATSPAMPPPSARPPALRRPAAPPPTVEINLINKKPCLVADTVKERAATPVAAVSTGRGSVALAKSSSSLPRRQATLCKVSKPETDGGDDGRESPMAAAEQPGEAVVAPETSTPEAPLDSSGEKLHAKANICPPCAGRPPVKKPKLNRTELAEQIDLLIQTRTELQTWEKGTRQRQQRGRLYVGSRLDLLPTCAVESIPDAQPPHHVLPGSHGFPRQLPYQHPPWPQHWLHTYPVVHLLSTHPSPPTDHHTAPPEVSRHCNWVARQPLLLAGDDGAGCRGCKIPDLNTRPEEEFGGVELEQQLRI
uniref:Uncharacterized protein n=1 Tax=Anthurium amnicola TaxID=1678845 RepID=A0A1D1Z1F4_9ARAE